VVRARYAGGGAVRLRSDAGRARADHDDRGPSRSQVVELRGVAGEDPGEDVVCRGRGQVEIAQQADLRGMVDELVDDVHREREAIGPALGRVEEPP